MIAPASYKSRGANALCFTVDKNIIQTDKTGRLREAVIAADKGVVIDKRPLFHVRASVIFRGAAVVHAAHTGASAVFENITIDMELAKGMSRIIN